jgi:hypothetical protein
MRSIVAGGCYFALVFACGFVLGPVRELVLVPRIGALAAVLCESVPMLLAIVCAARWIDARFRLAGVGEQGAAGALALLLLAAAEVLGAIWLRGLTGAAWVASFRTPPGLVSLALFAVFAVMPILVGPRPSRCARMP